MSQYYSFAPKPKPSLKERLQLLSQPVSAPAASQRGAESEAAQPATDSRTAAALSNSTLGAAASATAAQAATDAPSSSGIPSPASSWRSKAAPGSGMARAGPSSAPGRAAGSMTLGTAAASQTLDAYSSEFAWMRALPAATSTAAQLAAQQSAGASAAHPAGRSGSRVSAPAAMAADGDPDDLWDVEAEPKPKRRLAQRRKADAAAQADAGSDIEAPAEEAPSAPDSTEDADLDDELAADVAAAARGAGVGRKRGRSTAAAGGGGSSGGSGVGIGVGGIGSRAGGGDEDTAAAGSRKRRPADETEEERKARLLRRGRGRPLVRGSGASGSGAAASAALSSNDEDAQPNVANALPPGPLEPLRLRGDASGNFLAAEDEAATTDDEEMDGDAATLLCGAVPASIAQYLRPYQREGVEFMWRQYCAGRGGILADDMGLGKTVQTIAFLSALLGKGGFGSGPHPDPGRDPTIRVEGPAHSPRERQPILIVAPNSVMSNWQREFSTWGSFKVAKYHGNSKDSVLLAVKRGEYEVMVTSYGMLRGEGTLPSILDVPWHLVILDEAHQIKNEKTSGFKAAMALRTCFRFGLSGTVMSNYYKELWTVMEWANPGAMGTYRDFRKKYEKPMQIGQATDATHEEVIAKEDALALLNIETRKYLVCRKKKLIAHQMPEKIDQVVFCELSAAQMRAYMRALNSPDFTYIMSSKPCDCGSGAPRAACCYAGLPGCEDDREDTCTLWRHYHLCECPNPKSTTNPTGCKWHKPDGCQKLEGCQQPGIQCPWCLVMPALTVLRKIANHLELVKADPLLARTDLLKYQRLSEVAEMVLGEDVEELGGTDMDQRFLSNMSTTNCGKLAALEHLLKLWSTKGDKVLVFSHSVRMLTLVQALVTKHGWASEYLDGSTPEAQRQKKVDDFNDTPSTFVFMISTKAGGLGLNLTSANRVVIVDPSYNPADDMQAMDRAFRIGQRRNVHVYRLIATGTVEEAVYSRQIYKQQQSVMAVEGTNEKRYFQGVQKMKGREGELWGLSNLFAFTGNTIKTLDVLDAHTQKELHYKMQAYDPPDEVSRTAEEPNLLEGTTAASRRRRRREDPEDDAAGVEALAARLLQAEGHVPVADAPEEEDDAISDADDKPEAGAAEDDAEDDAEGAPGLLSADDDAADELAALEAAGSVMGIRAHHKILGPSAAEDDAARRARVAVAAEERTARLRMEAADAAGFQGAGMSSMAAGAGAGTSSVAAGVDLVPLSPPPPAAPVSSSQAPAARSSGGAVGSGGGGGADGGSRASVPAAGAAAGAGTSGRFWTGPQREPQRPGTAQNGAAGSLGHASDAAAPSSAAAAAATPSSGAAAPAGRKQLTMNGKAAAADDGGGVGGGGGGSCGPADAAVPAHGALDDDRTWLKANRRAAGSGAAPAVVTLTALESLASWERISVAEAAARLLALDEDGRFQLQQEYAMVHRR